MILILFLLFCSVELSAKVMLIDKIDTIVCGVKENAPLTLTDKEWKRSLNGSLIPFEQQVQMEIVRQQVIQDQLILDHSYADKYLDSIKTANSLTQNDLVELFAEVGLLYDEGKDQLIKQYTYDMFLHHKFKSQVLVTDDQVQEFYKNNPEIEPGLLEIKIATVSYDSKINKDDIKNKIDAFLNGDKDALSLEWSDVIELEDTALSKNKSFIATMKKGEIHLVDNGAEFDLYHLIRKTNAREKTLNERRAAIIDQLSKEQFEVLLNEYNQKPQNQVRLVHVD